MKTRVPPDAIRAELVGFTECRTMDMVARSYTPVRQLARRLIAAGVNPDLPLGVHRGEVLAMWFPSLTEAARSRV